MEIGIRELKAKLSEYVHRASEGEEVVVTDRGRPVARLVPFADVTLQRGFDEGWVEAPRRNGLAEPVLASSPLSAMTVLDEDRG